MDGESGLKEAPGTPPSRLFEAEIVSATANLFEAGRSPAFGIVFPSGFAFNLRRGPASDATKRRILAALIMSEDEA